MKNMKTLFRFQLKTDIRSVAVWSAVLFGLMSLYMFFFSTMQEMAQVKFEMLPQEYMQLMGVDEISQMSNYVTYFGMIFNILIIVISIYAVTTGVRILKKEEQNKTIEYLYSLSVTRKQIYWAKVLMALVSVMAVVFCTFIAGLVFGFVVGDETFVITDMFATAKITGTIPFLFLAMGMVMSASGSRYASGGLGSGIVMVSYMLGYLGNILEDRAEFLKYFSPFELLSPARAINPSGGTYCALAAVMILTVILLCGSAVIYGRRDFNL